MVCYYLLTYKIVIIKKKLAKTKQNKRSYNKRIQIFDERQLINKNIKVGQLPLRKYYFVSVYNKIIMSEEVEQQITQKYLFIITPVEIKSNSKIKSNNRKSILIKLGNKTAKCTQLGTSLELQIDVLYSKTLQKYCPIKGIIKIYDVGEDGSQIISCVGGFQTDELLNQGKTRVLLEKEIGTSKLKMEIKIVNSSQRKVSNQNNQQIAAKLSVLNEGNKESRLGMLKKELQKNSSSGSLNSANSSKISELGKGISEQGSSLKRSNLRVEGNIPRPIEIPFKNTSSSINKSLEKINQALSFKRFQEGTVTTKANEVLARAEVQTLKQQLAEQKRKLAWMEERYNKANQKQSNFKTFLAYFQAQLKTYLDSYRKLLSTIEINEGCVVAQIEQSSSRYCISYRNKEIKSTFEEFINLISRKVNEQLPAIELDYEAMEGSKSMQQLEQNKKELVILKKLATQKDKKIFSLERQVEGMEVTIRNLKETNKHLSEQNSYLRDKNQQIQLSLYHKESTIESLQQELDKLSAVMQQEQGKHYNSCLQIEQLRQQVSNCMEIIEKYRQKYGDLKNVKNRAIQMEIKECLRWIDQQNRDLQMSEIQETAQSEHEEDKGDSLSSVIRSIEIEKMPKEEMTVIRDQLVKILEKVDNLMAK